MVRKKKSKLSSLEDKQLPTFTTKEGSVTCVLTPYNFFIAPKKNSMVGRRLKVLKLEKNN